MYFLGIGQKQMETNNTNSHSSIGETVTGSAVGIPVVPVCALCAVLRSPVGLRALTLARLGGAVAGVARVAAALARWENRKWGG